MCREGLLTSSVPAAVCLLDFTEIGAFGSPSECKSATIQDVNESLEVRGWLRRPSWDLLRTAVCGGGRRRALPRLPVCRLGKHNPRTALALPALKQKYLVGRAVRWKSKKKKDQCHLTCRVFGSATASHKKKYL